MKILYHHRTQGEEPESIHISCIVSALRALGHDVIVVGPAPINRNAVHGKGSLLGRIKRAVHPGVFELLQLAYNLVVYFKLYRAVRECKPDLIYERYALYNFAGVLLARQTGIPLFLEVNTPYAHAWAKYYGLKFRRLAEKIETRTLLAAIHVITVTEAQRQFLARSGIPTEHVTVCHNAIEPSDFDSERYPLARHQLGLSDRHTVVGFVGTMNRWQGIPEFSNVIRAVLSANDNIRFLFVGDGEYRRSLQEYCEQHGYGGKVIFVGRKAHADIPALISAMDIAVLLNSNAYGSPMKIFEYLAMKKAVVAPRVGPVEEVLADGKTGLLIDPGNPEQMAERIMQLAEDPELRRRLGEEGRRYVVGNHTWRENAAKIISIYHGIY